MKTQVNIDEETRRKIIDLHNQHKKKIREIVSEVGKSSRDVTTILGNLQKGIVDNTISTAAGLEKGSSYSSTRQALPYYQSISKFEIVDRNI